MQLTAPFVKFSFNKRLAMHLTTSFIITYIVCIYKKQLSRLGGPMDNSLNPTSPKYNFGIIALAIATTILIPAIYTLIWKLPTSEIDMLIQAIPTEIILILIAFFLGEKLELNRVGFKKPDCKKLYWLIPEILLLIAIIFSISAPEVAPWPKVIIELFFLAILIAVYEEFLIRGIVLHTLARFGKIELAILGSGIIFGILHFTHYNGINGVETFQQIVETFSVGIYSAVIALALRSIIPLIITHFIYDFSLFIKLYFKSLSVNLITPEIIQTTLLDFSAYILPLAFLITAFTIYFFEKKNIKDYHKTLHKKYSNKKQVSSNLILKVITSLCFIIIGFSVISDLVFRLMI